MADPNWGSYLLASVWTAGTFAVAYFSHNPWLLLLLVFPVIVFVDRDMV